MKHVELITLQGAIEKSLNGLTIQIQSLTTGKWYEPATIVELACAVQEPRPIRVKPGTVPIQLWLVNGTPMVFNMDDPQKPVRLNFLGYKPCSDVIEIEMKDET